MRKSKSRVEKAGELRATPISNCEVCGFPKFKNHKCVEKADEEKNVKSLQVSNNPPSLPQQQIDNQDKYKTTRIISNERYLIAQRKIYSKEYVDFDNKQWISREDHEKEIKKEINELIMFHNEEIEGLNKEIKKVKELKLQWDFKKVYEEKVKELQDDKRNQTLTINIQVKEMQQRDFDKRVSTFREKICNEKAFTKGKIFRIFDECFGDEKR